MKAIEKMNESIFHVKASELMIKDGVIDIGLIRPLANLKIRRNKSRFRFYDDRNSDNWND